MIVTKYGVIRSHKAIDFRVKLELHKQRDQRVLGLEPFSHLTFLAVERDFQMQPNFHREFGTRMALFIMKQANYR